MDNVEELIKSRHSVRKYLDKEIESDKVSELNKLIKDINEKGEFNIQLVLNDPTTFEKFILSYGRLQNASNYIALVGKKTSSLEEDMGYYGEQIVLKAQSLGLNTCWVAGTYSKSSVKANILKDEKLVCIIAIGYGENQGKMHKSKTFNEVSTSKNVPEWYKKGIEFALLAPTAINQQKFKFKLKDNNIVSVKSGIGAHTKEDMGIAKYHFELGAGKENFNWEEEKVIKNGRY